MTICSEIAIAADHPAAEGHFPGNPVVPGAVLLSLVQEALTDAGLIATTGYSIRNAKFLRPTRPGDRLSMAFEPVGGGEVRFECRVAGEIVLSGSWSPSAASP
jgi:3-hydroxyacyl-[acyl-carrier-protein] dehydratase